MKTSHESPNEGTKKNLYCLLYILRKECQKEKCRRTNRFPEDKVLNIIIIFWADSRAQALGVAKH
jgi:hypothetical protein